MALQVSLPKPTILVVDDTADNLTVISSILKDFYSVKVATDGETALKIVNRDAVPDLILLDIMMRGMDGYEVCRQLKADPKTRDIPVIFLTALTDPHHEAKGLSLGAVDFVTKPISPPILTARIKNHLAFKASADFLRDQAEFLAREVSRRTEEITAIQDATVLAVASLAETNDDETTNHIRRVQHYILALAEKLRSHPRFGWFLNEGTINALYRTAPLHDIGNVAISNNLLLKRGKLTPDEFEQVRRHTTLGAQAIERAEQALGTKAPFFQWAKDIAMHHQEKWDGSGYPDGLKGEEIPIPARLMSVVDVYDALVSWRCYNETMMPHEDAVAAMKDGKGTHFDPDVVDAFVAIQGRFREIAERFPSQRRNT